MDVADELDSASIDLADGNLNFELKGVTCAHDEANLMALMTYNAMDKEYTEQLLNETLNKAYQEHIPSLSMLSAKKEKTKKEILVVKMTLEYPPHGESKQYKDGQPRPRYSAKDKRDPRIQYDKAPRGHHQRNPPIVESLHESGPWHTHVREGDPKQRRGWVDNPEVQGRLQNPLGSQ